MVTQQELRSRQRRIAQPKRALRSRRVSSVPSSSVRVVERNELEGLSSSPNALLDVSSLRSVLDKVDTQSERKSLAEALRRQAVVAREFAGSKRGREQTRLLDIAGFSSRAASAIESGSGVLSREERLLVGRARQPEKRSRELKEDYLSVGSAAQVRAKQAGREVRELKLEKEKAGFEGSVTEFAKEKKANEKEALKDFRETQRDVFVAGFAPSGISPKDVSGEQVAAATRRLVQSGVAQLRSPSGGKVGVVGETVFFTQKPSLSVQERFRDAPLSEAARKAIFGGGVSDARDINDKGVVASVVPEQRLLGLQSKQVEKRVGEVLGAVSVPQGIFFDDFEREQGPFARKQREINQRLVNYFDSPVGRFGSFEGEAVVPRDPSGRVISGSGGLSPTPFLSETARLVLSETAQFPFFLGAGASFLVESGLNVARNIRSPVVRSQVKAGVKAGLLAIPPAVVGFLSDVAPGGKPITPRGLATSIELGLPFSPKIARSSKGFLSPERVSAVGEDLSLSARTFGFQFGSRSLPLVTVGKVESGVAPVLVNFVKKPLNVVGDSSVVVSDVSLKTISSRSFVRLGARVPERFSPKDVVQGSGGRGLVAAPETALGTKLFEGFFAFSPEEVQRLRSQVLILREGFVEKGLKVKEAFFPVKSVEDQVSFVWFGYYSSVA